MNKPTDPEFEQIGTIVKRSLCDHDDKSYSPNVILTYPSKRSWICRKCLKEGIDTNACVSNDYDSLKRKIKHG